MDQRLEGCELSYGWTEIGNSSERLIKKKGGENPQSLGLYPLL